jgi:hypothetical protein
LALDRYGIQGFLHSASPKSGDAPVEMTQFQDVDMTQFWILETTPVLDVSKRRGFGCVEMTPV